MPRSRPSLRTVALGSPRTIGRRERTLISPRVPRNVSSTVWFFVATLAASQNFRLRRLLRLKSRSSYRMVTDDTYW